MDVPVARRPAHPGGPAPVTLLPVLLAAWAAMPADAESPEPYHRAGDAPLVYRGPGRERPEPRVDEIRIAWFGPAGDDASEGLEPWRGAVLALEEENAAGGYQGVPFRLVPAWSGSPWTAGAALLVRLVYRDEVWAVIASTDGAAAHLAAQIALKTRVLTISPASTDDTVHMARVPWTFSMSPGDDRLAALLADSVARVGRTLAVAAAAEHDSHASLVSLRRALTARGLPTPATVVEFSREDLDAGTLAKRLLAPRPQSIVVLAPAGAAARLVTDLRRREYPGVILGGAPLARRAFRRAAGPAAEGVTVPVFHEVGRAWDGFVSRYEQRWGEPPDDAAGQAYDAVRLLAQALQRAGLNRARLLDAWRDLSSSTAAATPVRWDALGRNDRRVRLGAWRDDVIAPVEGPQ